ncbi:MAG: hypothetical protein L6Q76_18865 [Polyangiaceae bacterium]|nr:hypothetical protein [Polyangiaceae bacterium]
MTAKAQPAGSNADPRPGENTGEGAPAPRLSTSPPSTEPSRVSAESAEAVPDASKPPPLHVEYIQYGVAIAAEMNIATGGTCPDDANVPCILGSGGGLAIRLGYRAPGPWYVGGAYEFIKMDSSNLYRLGIFQQLRAEVRYLPDIGLRAAPYVAFGLGGVAYGNEWGVETGGGLLYGGAGIEVEVSRLALIGASFVYRPVLIAPWKDTAGQERNLGIAQFFGFELLLEIRTEIGRR